MLVDDQGGQDAVDGDSAGQNNQQQFIRRHPAEIHSSSPSLNTVQPIHDALRN
jgi:hypothetical protein